MSCPQMYACFRLHQWSKVVQTPGAPLIRCLQLITPSPLGVTGIVVVRAARHILHVVAVVLGSHVFKEVDGATSSVLPADEPFDAVNAIEAEVLVDEVAEVDPHETVPMHVDTT